VIRDPREHRYEEESEPPWRTVLAFAVLAVVLLVVLVQALRVPGRSVEEAPGVSAPKERQSP
jgi:hypothetical protein